jgi:glycine hydroxymethyltransferase
MSYLKSVDPEIFGMLKSEAIRQHEGLELIASENFVSEAVMEAMGSVMTNKYAEGYPNKRYYGGCKYVDQAEIWRRNVANSFWMRPRQCPTAFRVTGQYGGYMACLKPGDTVLGMNLSHGGHLTHGHPVNFSGKLYNIIGYNVSRETETIDYDELLSLAKEHKPKMIIAGASAYPRIIDFKKFREAADAAGAILMVDIAHIAGLIVGFAPLPYPLRRFCDKYNS